MQWLAFVAVLTLPLTTVAAICVHAWLGTWPFYILGFVATAAIWGAAADGVKAFASEVILRNTPALPMETIRTQRTHTNVAGEKIVTTVTTQRPRSK